MAILQVTKRSSQDFPFCSESWQNDLIKFLSALIKLLFLANKRALGREIGPRKKLFETQVMLDNATGFDEAYFCDEKNEIVSGCLIRQKKVKCDAPIVL